MGLWKCLLFNYNPPLVTFEIQRLQIASRADQNRFNKKGSSVNHNEEPSTKQPIK